MRPIVVALVAVFVAAGPAMGQRARSVNPDDSVVAADALIRVRELAEAGTAPEALRVLQSILESEGDRLLPKAGDEDLYLPVRGIVHDMLLAWPELLEKYRAQEEPRAAELLGQGDTAGVERSRFLTTSGLEAVLRLAQGELENARFESSRLTLEQLERHPDRKPASAPAKDAAAIAGLIAVYLGRPEVTAWAN